MKRRRGGGPASPRRREPRPRGWALPGRAETDTEEEL